MSEIAFDRSAFGEINLPDQKELTAEAKKFLESHTSWLARLHEGVKDIVRTVVISGALSGAVYLGHESYQGFTQGNQEESKSAGEAIVTALLAGGTAVELYSWNKNKVRPASLTQP